MKNNTKDKIIHTERYFPKLFSNMDITDYGILFYNEDIKLSHDSNHAIILNEQLSDYSEIITKITKFYESKNIVPRIYSSLIPSQLNKFKHSLKKNNYKIEQYNNYYLIHNSKCIIKEPNTLKIKKIENENDLHSMETFFENNWNYKLLKEQIKNFNFHLLIGYENEIPVSKCSIQCVENIGRVDDVETKIEYRGKGYSRQMIRFLIKYNYEICNNKFIYLWYSNKTAGKIYKEAGFTDYENNFESWSAYK